MCTQSRNLLLSRKADIKSFRTSPSEKALVLQRALLCCSALPRTEPLGDVATVISFSEHFDLVPMNMALVLIEFAHISQFLMRSSMPTLQNAPNHDYAYPSSLSSSPTTPVLDNSGTTFAFLTKLPQNANSTRA